MTYNFTLIYPFNRKNTVRQVLKDLLIPRKWQHELRIKKNVLVNGNYRNFNEFVNLGDRLDFKIDFLTSSQSYPASGTLPDIVYEDDNLLVINKPKGQKTHPNLHETDTALNDCTTYLKKSPYIVHRLDMLTGGLLLVAKNPAVVPIMNRQLVSKTFKRDYLASVVHPENLKTRGTICQPLGQDPLDQRKRMVRPDGLKAVTHYQVLKQNAKEALVKLSLETGRTHQIRVHLASLGSPIVGDPLYNPEARTNEDLELCAYHMEFIKPFSFDKQSVDLPIFPFSSEKV